MELDRDVFENEWQRVVVDHAKPVYEQAQELLAYAESLESPRPSYTITEEASIYGIRVIAELQKSHSILTGTKHERIFSDVAEALAFAITINGVCYFWNESANYKVVWYTYEKENA